MGLQHAYVFRIFLERPFTEMLALQQRFPSLPPALRFRQAVAQDEAPIRPQVKEPAVIGFHRQHLID